MKDFIRINENDSVAVALSDLKSGYSCVIGEEQITLASDIARGHKFAVRDIREGEDVVKYGYPIGHATACIRAGEHVHVHNIKTNLGDDVSYTYNPVQIKTQVSDHAADTFLGYVRADGRVGIRNELWIIPTVGCVNMVAKGVAERCRNLCGSGVDAVVAFSHPYGCSQMGDDQENTRRALAGLIRHPNAAGVLVLGLGCENTNIDVLRPYLGDYDEERIRFLVCQDVEDETAEAVEIMNSLALLARQDVRTLVSVSKLVVGLKCGGSDGLSGITANPVTGSFSDLLVNAGGTTILTEVPEMFGAETILMNRARNEEVFAKMTELIRNFKDYYRNNNQVIYENPSPGNKAGGISTLEDKSLGCTQKSGSCEVADVLEYAKSVRCAGLNVLSAPGNDLVASTALAVSGAQLILFTTGRGTPFAAPVPTVKISTNSALCEHKKNWIDFDCGVLLEDGTTIAELGRELYDFVLETASGRATKSESEGYRDLAIFKQGVTL